MKRSTFSARRLACLAGVTLSVFVAAAGADPVVVTWTGQGNSPNWSNPLNWSPQVVPINGGGVEYQVVIASGVMVTVDPAMPASFAVNSISMNPSATLRVNAGRSVTLGTEAGLSGRVEVQSGASLAAAASPTPGALQRTTFLIDDGASYRSASTSYSSVQNPTGIIMNASGAGASLDLSSVTSLAFGHPSASVTHTILSTGAINLSNAQTATTTTNSRVALTTQQTGTIDLSSLTSIQNADILQGGGAISLGSLSSATRTTFRSNSGVLSLPALVSYSSSSTTAADLFNATGSNAVVRLANLSSMSLGTFGYQITAANGGQVQLPALSTIQRNADTALGLTATGGGVIDLRSLSSMVGSTLNQGFGIIASQAGSRIDLSGLQTISSLSITQISASTGASIDLSAAQTISNANITVNGGTLTVPAVTNINGSQIAVGGGSSLTLPGVTSYTNNANFGVQIFGSTGGVLSLPALQSISLGNAVSPNWSVLANGAGAVVDLSGLTAITVPSTSNISFTAQRGGTVNLSSLTTLPSRMGFTAENPGSTLNLSGLTAFSAAGETNVRALQGASVTLPALVTLGSAPNITFTVSGNGTQPGTLSFPSLQSTGTGAGRNFIASIGGVLDLPVLTSMTDANLELSDAGTAVNAPALTSVVRSRLSALNGANLTLGSVTSFVAPASIDYLTMTGASSVISLPSLTTLTIGQSGTSSFSSLSITQGTFSAPALQTVNYLGTASFGFDASNGGRILLNGLTNATNFGGVSAQGAGSRVELGLTSLGSAANVIVSASNGGSVLLPALSSLGTGNGRIISASNGSVLELPGLSTIGANTSVRFGANGTGAVLRLTNLTSVGTGSQGEMSATSGGRIEAPALTTLGSVNQYSLRVLGGVLDLPALVSLGTGTGHTILLNGGATLSAVQTTSLRSASITIDGAGTSLNTPNLTNIDGSNISLGGGANLTLSSGITSYSLGPGIGGLSVAGATLTIPSLTTISASPENIPTSLGSTSIRVTSAGRLALPALTTFQMLNGLTRVPFVVDTQGTLELNAMTDLRNVSITMTNGNLVAPNLVSMSEVDLRIQGGTYTAPNSLARIGLDGRYILSSDGATSVINAPGVTVLGAGAPGTSGMRSSIFASNGGTVNLPSVSSVQPVNNGRLTLNAATNGRILLPLLDRLDRVDYELGQGQIVTAPLVSIDGGRIILSNQAQFQLPASITSYGSLDAISLPAFSAQGAGTVLRLNPLQSIRIAERVATSSTLTVEATSSGVVDLSGLQSIVGVPGSTLVLRATSGGRIDVSSMPNLDSTRLNIEGTGVIQFGPIASINGSTVSTSSGAIFTLPANITAYSSANLNPVGALFRSSDTNSVTNLSALRSLILGNLSSPDLSFQLSAFSGLIDLSGVQSINRVAGARLFLQASSGTINLNAIPALLNDRVELSGSTARVLLGSVQSTDGTSFSVASGATFTLPAAVTQYSVGNSPVATSFAATGSAATQLNLSSLRSVVVGSTAQANQVHAVTASGGAVVDLSRVTSFSGINGGTITFNASTGGVIRLGDVVVSPLTTYTLTGTGTTFGTLRASGSFFNQVTAPARFNASTGIVSFALGAGPAIFEAAGQNLGTAGTASSNGGNFGLGQLRVGENSAAMTLTVVDRFDNGQRAGGGGGGAGGGGGEALYLYGIGSGGGSQNGLVLFNGSRLIISPETAVFARISGVMRDLRTLIPPGQTQVAFGNGFIVIPGPASAMALGCVLLPLTVRRRRSRA